MPAVLDTNRNTFGHYDALKAAGVKTVIRYLAAGLERNEKVIKAGEARAIAAAGLRLGLVYEINGKPTGSLTGQRDGIAAKSQAIAAGAPNDGTVILWYTIDWDAPISAMPGIISAVRAFKAAVEPQFRVGAYASGAVCDELWNLKLIAGRWLTDSLGFRGTHAAMTSGRYELLQTLPHTIAGLDTDPDAVHIGIDGKPADIGDFVPFSDGTPGDDPVYPPPDPGTAPAAPASVDDAILAIANKSEIMHYVWRDRGRAPPAYIQGMALTFAQTFRRFKAGHPAALEMAKANTGNDARDALSWYNSNFHALGMSNDAAGADTLRHLFVLMLGVGMRESSGKHCCGRDRSASNMSADTAEAGLFQTSYNAHACHPTFDQVMDEFLAGKADGYLSVFSRGVSCGGLDWANAGAGRGFAFQDLCKKQPAFAAESCAITLRNLRHHYGTVNRKEAELRKEADDMFSAIEAIA